MRARRSTKQCEACKRKVAARFRALVNLYLCTECYQVWWHTKELPGPDLEVDQAEETRW